MLADKTVLVVEDDSSLRTLLTLLVASEMGARVVEAADGVEALRRVAEEQPDLVLLDMMLPRLSGLDVVRRLRADAQTRRLAVLGISAAVEPADALEAGCSAFLSKPFELDELVEMVLRHLRPMSGGSRESYRLPPHKLRVAALGLRHRTAEMRDITLQAKRRTIGARARTVALMAAASSRRAVACPHGGPA